MAFMKYARASVVKPAVDISDWQAEVQAKALAERRLKKSSKALSKFDPDRYLLSHCTIVASVDTEESGEPLGKQMVDGFQIDRRYGDYLITPETSPYINSNFDAWERKLLLSCFHTFIGGDNFVEHLQVPELSKGKIIDAAARDIGDSVYIDILVATDRKHKPLVEAIESEQLQTLSMGCSVTFTQCSKCGNVAQDETQLCSHIKYMKGNTWIDGTGKKRKIAEICGHLKSEPGSVKFIEASWVGNPAFKGAVLRNILSPEEVRLMSGGLENKVQTAFSQAPRTSVPGTMSRAAKKSRFAQFDFGEDDGDEGGEPPVVKEKDPMDKAVDDMAQFIRDRAIEKVRGEMGEEPPPRADLYEDRNETIIKEAISRSSAWRKLAGVVASNVKDPKVSKRVTLGLLSYRQGGWGAVRNARLSSKEILAVARFLELFRGVPKTANSVEIYRTVTLVGGPSYYKSESEYLSACRRVLGRKLKGSERSALLAKGRLYDLGRP